MLKTSLLIITTTVANQAERLNPNPPPVFRSICIDSERLDFHFRSLRETKILRTTYIRALSKIR